MNAVRFSRCFCAHLKRDLNTTLKNNVRYYASGDPLIGVNVDSKTGISTVTFQRPPVNSLSLELLNELLNALLVIEKEKGRGMILTSSSPGIFSAGIDLMELYKPKEDRLKAYWMAFQDVWLKLFGASFSTAAAISGHAPAGGCLLSMSCDYRVMVKGKFRIGLNETQLGLAAPTWFIRTFTNSVPLRVAEKALIAGTLFSVEEALQHGVIDEVANDNAEAVSKAEAYISKLNKLPPFGVGQTKLTIRYEALNHLQTHRENDVRLFTEFVKSPDTQKAIELYVASLKKK